MGPVTPRSPSDNSALRSLLLSARSSGRVQAALSHAVKALRHPQGILFHLARAALGISSARRVGIPRSIKLYCSAWRKSDLDTELRSRRHHTCMRLSPTAPPVLKAMSMLLSCLPTAVAFARRSVVRGGTIAPQGRAIARLPLKTVVCRSGSTAAAASMRATGGDRKARRPRSSELPLFYNDVYRVDLPGGHRFPMEKYRLVREGLQDQLEEGGRATFAVSPVATLTDLCTTHERGYVERYFQGRFTDRENRTVGFPWSEASVKRSLSSVGGTVAATHAVCAGGELRDRLKGPGQPPPLFAGHIAGGTHHAFWDRGEGFCVFSDIAVAANVALRDYPETVRQILIVDCDVHQGNGNAVLFKSKPAVFTFSIHCKANYFSEKEESDLDLEVEDGSGDDEYLARLSARLPTLVDQVRPDLIFYQGGVDPLEHDRLGRLNLTREGLRLRNRLVYETSLSRGIPAVITMGGGYPTDLDPRSESFGHIVRSHRDVYEDAAQCLASSDWLQLRGRRGSRTDQGGGGAGADEFGKAIGEVAGKW